MSTSLFKRKVCRVAVGALLAVCAQVSAAADWVSGQVTAVNPGTNLIEIDGLAFNLPPALSSQIRALKPGQAVRYEADGKLIKRIETIKLPPT